MTKRIVDARGQSCPGPVIETRKALAEAGLESAEVLVDDDAAAENVSRMARSMGFSVRFEQDPAGYFRLGLEREGAGPDACRPAPRVVVLVASPTLGHGDDDLGRILMTAFLKTLKDVSPRPGAIVFVNGGVKLTSEGSDLVEAIRTLEDQGARVLSCGTCLDFYRLKDKLKVGSVSNMFEIASLLVAADRIVRP
ncbi:MAG: sulfurtransferase-like selenium metabolism protein YedF [Deltaproteobacteria bacterium]|nr:sulfurtransferase-like selenium metabolism protein YedF [Deltaproteobacteria bacterium]